MPTVMKLVRYYDKAKFVWDVVDNRPVRWRYLKAFRLEAHEGRGMVALTDDVDLAMRFTDEKAAHEFWQQQSKTVPLRPDGNANRPLTAFHATFEEVP